MSKQINTEKLYEKLEQALKTPAFQAIEINEKQKQQSIQLILELHKWNKAYNLTSIKALDEMLIKHLLDSFVVSPYLHGKHIIDVGTGPGLPGLPLAILNPEKQFVLLDSLGKRISFIKQVVHLLGLTNVTAVQSRIEDYQAEPLFDSVISRAFASFSDMLLWCQHVVSPQGKFLALKGKIIEEEFEAIPKQFDVEKIIELKVPFLDASRHLVQIKLK